MRKGERTYNMILQKVSALLNQQGYLATPISDIMNETGLKKGGIYNHFGSKEEIALKSFEYSVHTTGKYFVEAIRAKENAVDQLLAFVRAFSELIENRPIPGGCPIMNAAVESDDVHLELLELARQAMDGLSGLLRKTIQMGIEKNEIQSHVDSDHAVTVLISTLEGALMLSRLYDDKIYMQRAVEHLTEYLESSRKL